jgi:hypothetical protein
VTTNTGYFCSTTRAPIDEEEWPYLYCTSNSVSHNQSIVLTSSFFLGYNRILCLNAQFPQKAISSHQNGRLRARQIENRLVRLHQGYIRSSIRRSLRCSVLGAQRATEGRSYDCAPPQTTKTNDKAFTKITKLHSFSLFSLFTKPTKLSS